MICHHLQALEADLIAAGIRETWRGTPWTRNCREWVYFDVVLDTDALAARLHLPDCVRVHQNLDPKSGTERGFVCTACFDAIIGHIDGDSIYR